jgi:hypothetical protein
VKLVLRVVNAFERMAFRAIGALVRGLTGFLARVLRRGRFREWRREGQ